MTPTQPPKHELSFTRNHLQVLKANLGSVPIGTISWNATQSRSSEHDKYVVICRLPGIKERFFVSSELEGQTLLQKCVDLFVKKANLQ